MNRKIKRNVLIFSIVVIISGWIGFGLDVLLQNDFTKGIGLLLFILSPLVMSVILTLIEKKKLTSIGLKLNFRKNIKWYILCLFFDFVVLGCIYCLGLVSNGIEASKTSNIFLVILLTAIYAIPSTFFKNIFEEVGWRGYLVPRLFEKNNKVQNHLFISIVWATWHLPYWLFFLNREFLLSNSPYGITLTIVISYIGLFFLAVIYNNIRLITDSIWPGIIIHTMFNVLAMSYYQNIQYKASSEWLFSPSAYGVFYLIIILFVSVLFLRIKIKHNKK